MDAARFDAWTRRRFGLVVGGSTASLLGLSVLGNAEGKKHKHKKKKKHKRHASCTDGKKNGNETDVDCGGEKCPRCANGKHCLVANDCVSGTCTGEVCVDCTPTQLCGSDVNGTCRCDEDFETGDPVCDANQALGNTVTSCDDCPEGTETCVTINGLLFNCYKRCGSA